MPVQVNFKTRKSFVGVFIKTPDFDELKSKNFWRIVAESNIESYVKSKNMNLVRLFNGVEITKLVALKPEVTGQKTVSNRK